MYLFFFNTAYYRECRVEEDVFESINDDNGMEDMTSGVYFWV